MKTNNSSNNSSAGYFICLEGIDGSGKSTIGTRAAACLRDHGVDVVFVSRNTKPSDSLAAQRSTALAEMLWDYPQDVEVRRLGERHLILLMASWYQLFDQFVVRPALRAGKVVITDQWVYKYIARFRAMGAEPVESLFSGLSTPDLVVWMRIDPQLAASRRQAYKQTEANSQSTPTETTFVDFQRLVAAELTKLSTETWHAVDATATPDVVLGQVLKLMYCTAGERSLGVGTAPPLAHTLVRPSDGMSPTHSR
ncbi:dTMP kinase [Sorangium sp. So ce726]|uniref:dTMP kinase n=1 Tax=Sorangium sp. So ce726 TaxID=3133319 RepID=UPI003F5DD529